MNFVGSDNNSWARKNYVEIMDHKESSRTMGKTDLHKLSRFLPGNAVNSVLKMEPILRTVHFECVHTVI